MKIEYLKSGDYYVPALTVPDDCYSIGKFSIFARYDICSLTEFITISLSMSSAIIINLHLSGKIA